MIEYTSTHPSIRHIDQLEGFFEGWPEPPGRGVLFRILGSSDVSILARDSEQGNRIVGFVAATTDTVLTAHITLLEVLPHHRGRGVGTELVRRAVAELDRIYAIDVVCDPELEGFYERLGFSRLSGMALRRPDRIPKVRAEPFGWTELGFDDDDGSMTELPASLDEDSKEEDPKEHAIPSWIQPSAASLAAPAIVPPAILHRDAQLVVWISGIEVADGGFSVTVSARAIAESADLLDAFGWFHGLRGYSRDDHDRGRQIVREDLPDEVFRFGLHLADGSEVKNTDRWMDLDWEKRPTGSVMSGRDGGGGGSHYDASYWVWPLPPAGRTVAWCEWPAGGVPRSEAELDTAAILRAAVSS